MPFFAKGFLVDGKKNPSPDAATSLALALPGWGQFSGCLPRVSPTHSHILILIDALKISVLTTESGP